jgi:GT2 family glycosyltransferase
VWSVIVLVHDRIAMSVRCLASLAATTSTTSDRGDWEVVCVDNASTEDVAPLQDAGARFARFRLLRNTRNLAFAEANNRAVRDCQGRRLLFLNNDVMLDAATVDGLMRATSDPAIGVAGARLLYPGRTRVQHAGLVPTLWGYVSNYGVGATAEDRRFHGLQTRPAVSGAVFALDRGLFEQVGGFDETYRWGYEDIDLCFRIAARGQKIVCIGEGESEHHESATLADRRAPADLPHNYAAYRQRWDAWLSPREAAYVEMLRHQRIRRVVIFGAGLAARGLCETLERAGIETVAFAVTALPADRPSLLDRPVLTFDDASTLSFDRVIAGSQFYFEVESKLAQLDPTGAALFPATWS